jgi:hypothetical protein
LPSKDTLTAAQNLCKFSFFILSFAANIPKSYRQIKNAPSFLIFAGAKLTIIFLDGKSNPEFFTADVTLSRDSLTAAS